MRSTKFFDERTDQSEVKARIVQKYFAAWAKVVMATADRYYGKIAYIDLYAGPGRYKDGAVSTPLLVLQYAIDHPRISQLLVGYFNDADSSKTAALQSEIDKLPGIENLKHKPVVSCGEIDSDAEKYFSETTMVPSFSFIDPWGYKGLSLKIVNGVIKDWGCDCIFFFNYNRINAGISNDVVEKHINALFGAERANALRTRLEGVSPAMRESMILEEMTLAIKEMGGKYVLPFRFKNPAGRPTHHLIFVSKNFLGYDIMKQIMTKESSTKDQGVPSFTYSPADAAMPLLFSLQRPLDELKEILLRDFAGQELSVDKIYKRHSVDTPYILKNYKETLKELEKEKKINVRSLRIKRRKGTMAGHLLVQFPTSSKNGE